MKSDEEYLESLLQAAMNPNENKEEDFQEEESLQSSEIDFDLMQTVDDVSDLIPKESDFINEKSEEDVSWDDLLAELEGIGEVQSDIGKDFTSREDDEIQREEESSDNVDITELLDKMEGEDDDLSEINDLLKKSDSGKPIEELEEEIALIPNKKEKPKKEKRGLFGRKKKKIIEEENESQNQEHNINLVKETVQELDLSSSIEDINSELELIPEKKEKVTEKKEGFFSKLLHVLTEEVEEDDEASAGKKKKDDLVKGIDENTAILDELELEDQVAKKGKKKVKKEKIKKEKIKKEKIKKVKKVEEPFDGKELPKKMVIRIIILCGSILIMILLMNTFLLQYKNLNEAREAYIKNDYKTAYHALIGSNLNKSDTLLLEKTTLLMKLERQYESFINYEKIEMHMEALDALITGYNVYDSLKVEAQNQNILPELENIKKKINYSLNESFNVSEELALEISQITDPFTYTKRLKEIVNKEPGAVSLENQSKEQSDVITQEQQEPDNLLPEEQEILSEQEND